MEPEHTCARETEGEDEKEKEERAHEIRNERYMKNIAE